MNYDKMLCYDCERIYSGDQFPPCDVCGLDILSDDCDIPEDEKPAYLCLYHASKLKYNDLDMIVCRECWFRVGLFIQNYITKPKTKK